MLKPRYKLWLEKEGKVFGDGPYQLLLGVEASGSLSQAARNLNMSYSQAHTLMKRLGQKLGFPLLSSKVGGYAGGETTITPEAKQLMQSYQAFAAQCDTAILEAFCQHFPQYLADATSLAATLKLPAQAVISAVGGGGKTTTLWRLAQELAALKQKVLVTTTTHMRLPTPDQAYTTILAPVDHLLGQLRPLIAAGRILACGSSDAEDKLQSVDAAFVQAAAPYFDYILVEADGSQGKPLKAPAAHEPAIPPNSNLVLILVGLDGVGQPLSPQICHRPEIFGALSGLAANATITVQDLTQVLCAAQGGLKNLPPQARYCYCLNKVDTLAGQQYGQALAASLLAAGAPQVLLYSAASQTACPISLPEDEALC